MKTLLLVVVNLFCFLSIGFSQSTIPGNVRPGPVPFLGWNAGGVAGSLNIRNDFAGQPINFFTGGAAPAFQRMTILGSGGPTAGFVGIGIAAPLYRLDVQDKINITNNNALGFGYFINGFDILQVPGTENTFVGKGN